MNVTSGELCRKVEALEWEMGEPSPWSCWELWGTGQLSPWLQSKQKRSFRRVDFSWVELESCFSDGGCIAQGSRSVHP